VPQIYREVETKFDVPPDFEVPDLLAFAGDGGREEVDVVQLASTYLDTSAHDLLRFRLTLRRRIGDADQGWQLKVPGDGARTELHWPEADSVEDLPDEARALLTPFLGSDVVRPVARLEVSRTRHRLYSADDRLLAEVAHDDVRVVDLGGGVRSRRWHEVEVELGTGDSDLADQVAQALIGAGAVSSTSRSKLARALVGIGNEGLGAAHTSAGSVLLDYLSAQSDAVIGGHFAIAGDWPEAVHRTRVALRRLRSTIRSFVDFFDADQAQHFEADLAWYAGVLAPVRDAEVVPARILAGLSGLPAGLVVGPIQARVQERFAADATRHRADLLSALTGPQYAALLGEIVRWRDDPPFTANAGRPARTLGVIVDRLEKTLAKRVRTATSPTGTDQDMHRAREIAKRTRYAAEATGAPVPAGVLALQNRLGEFQDSVGAHDALVLLADDARTRGEDTFTYGVLTADEHRIRERIKRKTKI
jgi:inorganic triphosphatase YgiF